MRMASKQQARIARPVQVARVLRLVSSILEFQSQTKGKRPNILSPLRHCGSPEFFHHQRRSRRSLATRRGAHKPQRHSQSSLVVNDARNLDQEVSLTSLTALRSSLPVNDTRNLHQQGLASSRQSFRRVHGEIRCSRLSSSSRLPYVFFCTSLVFTTSLVFWTSLETLETGFFLSTSRLCPSTASLPFTQPRPGRPPLS